MLTEKFVHMGFLYVTIKGIVKSKGEHPNGKQIIIN